MKRIVALAFVMICGEKLFAAEADFHKFELWGTSTKIEKLGLFWGFTNGLLVGAAHPLRSDATLARQLLACLNDDDSHPTASQAIAMIDKYYQDSPEKWNSPLGQAMVEALMVKNGPCARFEESGWKGSAERPVALPLGAGDDRKADDRKIAGTYDELMGLLHQAYNCGYADGAVFLATYDIPGQKREERKHMLNVADGMRRKRDQEKCGQVVDALGLAGQR